jgi:hypothetical protein
MSSQLQNCVDCGKALSRTATTCGNCSSTDPFGKKRRSDRFYQWFVGLGVCLEKKRSYCQFDSKLAQIVQQQGRNGQLRIGFGSAKHPDCRGITVDELQKIQFDRLDFTNFYEDLMNNQKIPDSGVLTQKVKEQIADQLKQAGQ